MTDADAGYVQDLLENVSVYFENIKNITPIQKKSRKFNTQLFPSPMTDINHRLSATSASVSQLSANDYLSIQNRSVEKTLKLFNKVTVAELREYLANDYATYVKHDGHKSLLSLFDSTGDIDCQDIWLAQIRMSYEEAQTYSSVDFLKILYDQVKGLRETSLTTDELLATVKMETDSNFSEHNIKIYIAKYRKLIRTNPSILKSRTCDKFVEDFISKLHPVKLRQRCLDENCATLEEVYAVLLHNTKDGKDGIIYRFGENYTGSVITVPIKSDTVRSKPRWQQRQQEGEKAAASIITAAAATHPGPRTFFPPRKCFGCQAVKWSIL